MTEPTGFLTIARYFCAVCGNEEVAGTDEIGPLCQPFLDGPFRDAWEALQLIRNEWGVCCWGMSSELGFGRTWEERVRNLGPATHLYVHPKSHGESTYRADGSNDGIDVECGVNLYQTNASCYWIFDNDTIGMSQGEPLDGGPVSYAQDGTAFLDALATILESAAEQAYMGDHGQCAICGGHYYMPNGPCCEGGDPGEDYDKCGNCDHTREDHPDDKCSVCECHQWDEIPDDADEAVTAESCDCGQDEEALERCDCGHNFASHDPDRDASIEACAYLGFCGECNGADEAGMTPADYAASDFAYDAARERGRI